MKTKDEMFVSGVALMKRFCALNNIQEPKVERLNPSQRNYHIGTCAYYRPHTIHVMVEKCANRGFGGRAWSWPGYAIDRTPYGVIQHELAHHVDTLRTGEVDAKDMLLVLLFSKRIYDQSKEKPLTGYLGTDSNTATFFMEWFAENFRLFVTNPSFCAALRPKFYEAVLNRGLKPLERGHWEAVLIENGANERILFQARKKVSG